MRIPFQNGNTITPQMIWDSDLGKLIEAAAYALQRGPDGDLERRVDEIVDAFARLQAEDGYLDSWFQRVRPGERWTNLRDCHELYNMGHLIEGGRGLLRRDRQAQADGCDVPLRGPRPRRLRPRAGAA